MSKSSSRANSPEVYEDNLISAAWARIFLDLICNPGTEISPLVVSLGGFSKDNNTDEIESIRHELDACLKKKRQHSVERVAFTIFPERIWKIARPDRAKLFELYRQAYPRYVAMNRRENRRGIYFGRLTMFRDNLESSGPCDGNQLEWIISQHDSRNSVRDSLLQASIFDPAQDHVPDARLQFPCLQHVSFVPTRDGLVLNAFYATQYIFEKAYGNYLGLAHLGRFMAHELDMDFARLNVTVGVAKIGQIAKSDPVIQPLVDMCQEAICDPSGTTTSSRAAER